MLVVERHIREFQTKEVHRPLLHEKIAALAPVPLSTAVSIQDDNWLALFPQCIVCLRQQASMPVRVSLVQEKIDGALQVEGAP